MGVGDVRTIAVGAEPLTPEAWQPCGWLPADDTDPRDQTYTYEFLWDDPHVNVIGHGYDEGEHTVRGGVCGAWHWGSFPLGTESVRLFNVQGKCNLEGNARADLPNRVSARFEVLT